MDNEMLITQQILIAAKCRLQNRDHRLILQHNMLLSVISKILVFQKIFMGSPLLLKCHKNDRFFMFRKLATAFR